MDPFRALRYPGLLTIAITALFYNMGFFTLLAIRALPARHDRLAGRLDLLRLGPAARDHVGLGRADPAAAVRLGAGRARLADVVRARTSP
jgi:hypothetical protein